MDHTYLPKLIWKTKQTSNLLYTVFGMAGHWGFGFTLLSECIYLGLILHCSFLFIATIHCPATAVSALQYLRCSKHEQYHLSILSWRHAQPEPAAARTLDTEAAAEAAWCQDPVSRQSLAASPPPGPRRGPAAADISTLSTCSLALSSPLFCCVFLNSTYLF